MDQFWLGHVVIVAICFTAIWTQYIYNKTGKVKKAFMEGFAPAMFCVSLIFTYFYAPEGWISRRLDRVLFSLIVSGALLALLLYTRYSLLIIKNRFVVVARVVRKILKRRLIRFGLYKISWLREENGNTVSKTSTTNRFFVHDECPACKRGKLMYPSTDGQRTMSYAAEASLPHKLMCDHCGKRFDGFYIRGLQM